MKTDFKFLAKITGIALFGLALVLGAPAQADFPKLNQSFLDQHLPELELVVETALETAENQAAYLEAARQILILRGEALMELNQKTPLTTFDGIETQDRFDREVVLGLDRVVDAAVAADTTLPSEEEAVVFYQVMGDIPPLGEHPVGFMVLGLSNISVITADTLAARALLPSESIAKLALRLMKHGTDLYGRRVGDIFAENAADNFRQNSVIGRMKCPKDQGAYRINNLKNKLGGDDSISTVYFLQCEACSEPATIRFKLDLPSRLNQAAERQNLKKKPVPRRPDAGLDP